MRARETADSRARLVARVAARVERRARLGREVERVRVGDAFARPHCSRIRHVSEHRARFSRFAPRASYCATTRPIDRDARDRPTDRRYMRQHHE
jgi:hypothetical protein